MTIDELIQALEKAKEQVGNMYIHISCDLCDITDYHIAIDHDWNSGEDFAVIVADEIDEF